MDPNLIDLSTALKLLALPRDIGRHPETGEMITAGSGRFGPYIKMGMRYKSLSDTDDLLTVGINRAVSLLAEPDKGRRGAQGAGSAKPLGEHPKDSKPVTVNSGRYGPYVKWGKVMATITKGYDSDTLTLEQALEIIETKLAKGGKTKAQAEEKKKPAKKAKVAASSKKKTAKKPAKKPATTKTKVKKT
jgi:DNA topoisomerase-1